MYSLPSVVGAWLVCTPGLALNFPGLSVLDFIVFFPVDVMRSSHLYNCVKYKYAYDTRIIHIYGGRAVLHRRRKIGRQRQTRRAGSMKNLAGDGLPRSPLWHATRKPLKSPLPCFFVQVQTQRFQFGFVVTFMRSSSAMDTTRRCCMYTTGTPG